jgi:hypothetical protein
VDHRGSSPPCTDLHCRLEELIGARPTAAPGHGGLPQLHREDEELAEVRFRALPEAEGRHGDRATAVKRQWWQRSVWVALGCGEKRRGLGRGAVWNGVLVGSFYRAGVGCQGGEGGGNGR